MKKTIISTLTALTLSTTALLAANAQTTPINPFEEIQKLQQEMDQIFNRFHQRFLNDAAFVKFNDTFANSPAIDLKDSKDKYVIKADIPGVDKKSIEVSEKDGLLTIKAKTSREKEEKKENFIKQERFVGEFLRAITLPKDADASKMKTDYKNGVLKIVIPKK